MKTASNIKDTLSTILGILSAIAGSVILAGQNGVILPPIVTTICGIIVTASIAVIGVLTGKTPAGTTKTEEQVLNSNQPKQ